MIAEWKPFRIGGLTIRTPVVLAALAGYSDLAYRRLCRDLGAPYCTTEMLLDRSILVSGKLRRRLLTLTEDDHPVAGQLIGREPDEMARAAVLLCEKGFDAVDVNFACPMRKALRRGRGGALMGEPDQAKAILRAVVTAAGDKPVTVKLRSALAWSDRGHGTFWQIAEGAFDVGVAALCVHGRSVEARYRGAADWAFLADVKRRFPDRTIVGSGDLRHPADALRMLAETSVDGVTAARGALGNPWFFRQAADLAAGRPAYHPPLAEQREVLIRHFEQSCLLYGDERGPKHMRKFGIKYSHLHPSPRRLRMAFVEVKSADDWLGVLDEHYPATYDEPTRPLGSAVE